MHIATRGRLDGEYGIATRGYLICPDIVPRYPDRGLVSPLERLAELKRLRGWSAEVAEHPGWHAFQRELEWSGSVGQPVVMSASMLESDLAARAEAMSVGVELEDDAMRGRVEADRRTGVMSTGDAEGMLEGGGLLGDVQDDVPHC